MKLYNGRVHRPEHAIIIWRTSFLCVFSFLYGIKAGYYIHSLVPGSIFFTSINYWRDPVYYSWSRRIDIFFVRTSLFYLLIIAYKCQYYKYFYTLILLSVLCYPISLYTNFKKQYLISVYVHCMLHILANMATVTLFSGDIIPFHSNDIILYFIS